jgi:hypothetical protein
MLSHLYLVELRKAIGKMCCHNRLKTIFGTKFVSKALLAFALHYSSSMARQEQKRFMKRHLGLPSGQLTTTLQSMIQQFNSYLPYLPGKGNKFDADDIRDIVYHALSAYVHTIIAISDYKWYNKNKLDDKVCAYFDCLLVIERQETGI